VCRTLHSFSSSRENYGKLRTDQASEPAFLVKCIDAQANMKSWSSVVSFDCSQTSHKQDHALWALCLMSSLAQHCVLQHNPCHCLCQWGVPFHY
jgi:hypothetical protein